jgi:hypothetical protein
MSNGEFGKSLGYPHPKSCGPQNRVNVLFRLPHVVNTLGLLHHHQ